LAGDGENWDGGYRRQIRRGEGPPVQPKFSQPSKHTTKHDAPQWVREKWLGPELPLACGDSGARQAITSGVLSGPRNRLIALWWALRGRLEGKSGYAVDANEAVRIFEGTAPEAAAWWRQNVPRLQHGKRKFLFAPAVCEVVSKPLK
jgi:hypothetical protein